MKPDSNLSGSYVRLLDATDRWFYGKLTEWSHNHVAVTPANGLTKTFSTWEIGALQRRIRIKRDRVEAAIAGARAAASVLSVPAGFFASAVVTFDNSWFSTVRPMMALMSFVAGTVAGASIGAGIGSLFGAVLGPLTRKKEWIDVEIEPIHPVFA